MELEANANRIIKQSSNSKTVPDIPAPNQPKATSAPEYVMNTAKPSGQLITSQSSILKAQNFDTPRQDDNIDQGLFKETFDSPCTI